MAALDDAVELVCWYESQPDCGTYAKDAAIATHLGWLIGGMRAPSSSSALRRGGDQSKGDAARVRRARRYVDRHNTTQPFVGYSFGTKRNGSGVTFSMLITPRMGGALAALDESVGEEIGRSVQLHNQVAAENARKIGKFMEAEARYIKDSAYEKAMICHDIVKEIQATGSVTMVTLQEARRLGILAAVGADA